jgi:hypothetical protein
MKRLLALIITIVLLGSVAMAATYPATATFTYNFKDTSIPPKDETGPVVVKLYNNATDALVSTITVTAAVTNQAMPAFTVTVPDNATTNVQFYATATDAAGNVSARGMSNIVAVKGLDTIGPSTINITITVTP